MWMYRKYENARSALNLLRSYRELFDIDIVDGAFENLDNPCHDILTRLLEGRKRYSQLLITNNRNLSKDVSALNLMESYRGKDISVCFIDIMGKLHWCEG